MCAREDSICSSLIHPANGYLVGPVLHQTYIGYHDWHFRDARWMCRRFLVTNKEKKYGNYKIHLWVISARWTHTFFNQNERPTGWLFTRKIKSTQHFWMIWQKNFIFELARSGVTRWICVLLPGADFCWRHQTSFFSVKSWRRFITSSQARARWFCSPNTRIIKACCFHAALLILKIFHIESWGWIFCWVWKAKRPTFFWLLWRFKTLMRSVLFSPDGV